MTNAASIGISLAKQCLAILRKKKSLLLFPFISTIFTVIALVACLYPIAHTEKLLFLNPKAVTREMLVVYYVLFLILFFLSHLFVAFANAGLAYCIDKELRKEPYTITQGFISIFKHAPRLYFWTTIMTSFGIFVRFAEYWSDRWPNSKLETELLAGLPWLMASFFVIPLLIIENLPTFSALKKSAHLFRSAWGKEVIAQHNINFIIAPLRIVSVIPAVIGVLIDHHTALIIGSTFTAITFLSISILNLTRYAILTQAFYFYAEKIPLSEHFEMDTLKCAFRAKNTA